MSVQTQPLSSRLLQRLGVSILCMLFLVVTPLTLIRLADGNPAPHANLAIAHR